MFIVLGLEELEGIFVGRLPAEVVFERSFEGWKSEGFDQASPLDLSLGKMRAVEPSASSSDQKTAIPVKLFIGYAREDADMLDALSVHLAVLEDCGIIDAWHDRLISPGDEWETEIDVGLENAEIVVLLISAYFFASKYCREVELPRALERHRAGEVRLLPVLVRACDWKATSLGKIQVLPETGKPVTQWDNVDVAWAGVARAIRRIASQAR